MSKAAGTKDKILMKASEIFSEYGYKETTIRMISEKAGVNVASINYHYRNKENLYLEVIRYWAADAFRDYPLDKLESADTSPEEKIRLFIYYTLLCLLGEDGRGTGFGRLIALEASTSPSAVVSEVIGDTIGRPTESLRNAVKSLTACCDEDQIQVYTACIVGQTVYFYLSRNLTESLFGIKPPEDKTGIRKMAEQIYEFAINALKGEGQVR